MRQYFIIDFDSTFIKTEGLDALAEVVLENHPEKEKIVSDIKALTNQGMEGKLPFDKSLLKRLSLLTPNKTHIEKTAKKLKKQISDSVLRNKAFFKEYKDAIIIVSGGFKEFILPVVEQVGLTHENIYANEFMFDNNGRVIGVDTKNPLSGKNGKSKLVKSLKLDGEVYIIGDGYTDYEIKEHVERSTFIAFAENVKREKVIEKADKVVTSLDEFLYDLKLPMALSYPKSRLKVLLLENINQTAIDLFEQEGYAVTFYEKSLPKEELIKRIHDVSILGIRSRTQVDKEILDAAPKLLAIGAFCVGTEQVDLTTAALRGVAVFNDPYSNSRSVAELAMGEIIMLMRGVFEKSKQMHTGVWDKSAKGSFEVRGKTLGIVGYGNIGHQLGELAQSMGMNVLYYDIAETPMYGTAKPVDSLKTLLKSSDVVTLHVDGRKENKNLFSEKEFEQMKDGVLFLNLSRGKVVDINALAAAIKSGKVAGCAVDVFPKEPKGKDEPFVSELQGLPNVLLTPHIAGSTKEAQEAIGSFVAKRISMYINFGSTYLSANLPDPRPASNKNAHRLLHLHRNVPGILAQINSILSENNMNVLAQYLKTNEDVGYVVTDVDKKYDKTVLEKLKQIEGTIRFRILY